MMTAKNVSVSVNVIRHPPFRQKPPGEKTFKSPCPELCLVPGNKLRTGKESAACVSDTAPAALAGGKVSDKIGQIATKPPMVVQNGCGRLLFFCVFCASDHASLFFSRSLVYSARVAFSTAMTMTPTSAKMAVHMLAMPSAPRMRQMPLTPSAKTMFW